MQFEFTKWQGAGNDFVIVNGFKNTIADYEEAAIAVCDRHFGIGADGLVLILPSDVADFKMRIFNSDGSEAEMCGNVTRCVAKYVYEEKMTDKTKLTIETKAGLIKPEIILTATGDVHFVKVNMGKPILCGETIPVTGFGQEKVIAQPLEIGNCSYTITCVSMGNPHCVIFVDDINLIDLEKVGPLIEKHNIFPKKINVEFAQINNRNEIRMRVWERGAGITLACGTGSSATLVAAVLNNKTDRAANLLLDGGNLYVEWGDDDCIYMSGPAKKVFTGVYTR